MANISVARQAAIAAGEPTYFTGKPCKRGHLSDRLTSSSTCIDCAQLNYAVNERERYRNLNNTLHVQLRQRKSYSLNKGIPFSIELEDIEQPTHCPILGLELNYKWSGSAGISADPAKATLDRLDPTKGYISGNVFVISWKANQLKTNVTVDELEKILRYIKERIND